MKIMTTNSRTIKNTSLGNEYKETDLLRVIILVKLQQSAVARHQPINNRRTVFSAQSVPMVVRAKMEYVMPSLSIEHNPYL
jgi:hypothetical protein